jgi:SAM-dependent methyltransferase
MKNIHQETVASFGDEWSRFDQNGLSDAESQDIFAEYFAVFPWSDLPPDAEGFDMGCGTGRWAQWAAPRVGRLHCIDPSAALDIARSKLSSHTNIDFHSATVDEPGLPLNSQDFGYSLGVLHHVPDTAKAIQSCVDLLKPGAPLLLYLYYAFDNRPLWFRFIWKASDAVRRVICRLPAALKGLITDLIALGVYFPLARFAKIAERVGIRTTNLPLTYYRNHSLYTMRTDARDRFGTPLEQRFTKAQIAGMMRSAGLVNVRFSAGAPYWCAVGIKQG